MSKCAKKNCENDKEEGSNYCADHQPAKSQRKPVLKLDRSRGGSRSSATKRMPVGAPGPKPPPR